jgi:hypothetical protein
MALSLKRQFWISLVAATIFYVTMLAWTLPAITKAAGGSLPFDMRPLGYDFGAAQSFLRALTADGRELYLNVQQKLDVVYPALLAFVLGLGIAILCPVRFGSWKWALAAVSVPGSLFDYRENALVRRLLLSDPETLPQDLVAMASQATVMKSLFTSVAMGLLLILFLSWLYQMWKTRTGGAGI